MLYKLTPLNDCWKSKLASLAGKFFKSGKLIDYFKIFKACKKLAFLIMSKFAYYGLCPFLIEK